MHGRLVGEREQHVRSTESACRSPRRAGRCGRWSRQTACRRQTAASRRGSRTSRHTPPGEWPGVGWTAISRSPTVRRCARLVESVHRRLRRRPASRTSGPAARRRDRGSRRRGAATMSTQTPPWPADARDVIEVRVGQQHGLDGQPLGGRERESSSTSSPGSISTASSDRSEATTYPFFMNGGTAAVKMRNDLDDIIEGLMIPVDDILAAGRRLAPHLPPTPLIHSPWLSTLASADVRLKLESLQVTRSFKVRGALNALTRLAARNPPPVVVTASAGNHGRAVAWAAERLGLRRDRVHARLGATGQARTHSRARRRAAADRRRLRRRRADGDGICRVNRRDLRLAVQPRGRDRRRRDRRASRFATPGRTSTRSSSPSAAAVSSAASRAWPRP